MTNNSKLSGSADMTPEERKQNLEEMGKDILGYLRYCYENQNLQKEKEIIGLAGHYAIEYCGTEKDRFELFVNKFLSFQEKLDYYSAKKDREGFNKAFEIIFHLKRRNHFPGKYQGIRRLIGLLLNRNTNSGYKLYKDQIVSHELLETLNTEKTKGIDNIKESTKSELLSGFDSQIDRELSDDELYTEYDYNEKILIGEDYLEKKYLENTFSNKTKKEALKKTIKEFRNEESKNHSEDELDQIVGLFYEKNKDIISQ